MTNDRLCEEIRPQLDNLAVVLVRPKFAENIGAAARLCHNMGIGRLILVRDEEPDGERMRMMATHNAVKVLDAMERHPTLAAALAPFSHVVGTSARTGRQRRNCSSPREMAAGLVGLLAANRVALVFGPEDRGLENEDLALCNQLVTIATVGFSSLNLAQAVAILCHETLAALLEVHHRGGGGAAPKQATSVEMENMYRHADEALRKIGFLKEGDHEYWMRSIRQFLGRIGMRSREVRLLRGVCRQFLWYENRRAARRGDEAGDGERKDGNDGAESYPA